MKFINQQFKLNAIINEAFIIRAQFQRSTITWSIFDTLQINCVKSIDKITNSNENQFRIGLVIEINLNYNVIYTFHLLSDATVYSRVFIAIVRLVSDPFELASRTATLPRKLMINFVKSWIFIMINIFVPKRSLVCL